MFNNRQSHERNRTTFSPSTKKSFKHVKRFGIKSTTIASTRSMEKCSKKKKKHGCDEFGNASNKMERNVSPPHGYTKKNVKVFVKNMTTSAETKADQRTKGSNTEDGYCRKAPLLDEIFLSLIQAVRNQRIMLQAADASQARAQCRCQDSTFWGVFKTSARSW